MATALIQLVGQFNIGTDLSVSIIDNTTNLPIDLGGRLKSFKADPIINQVVSDPIDNGGFDQTRQIRKGHTGTIMVDRAYGALDILDSTMESEYHQRVAQRYFTITALVNNSSAGVGLTTYVYHYCLLEIKSSGTFAKEGTVEVTVDFKAQYRTVTGS